MPIFKSKNRDGDRSVNFMAGESILSIPKGTATNVTLNKSLNRLEFRNRLKRSSDPIILQLSKITAVTKLNEKEIIEKSKSVAGRAVVGGIVLGPVGALVGGMSGIGNKQRSDYKTYLVINYTSNGDTNAISLEIVGASIGWDKFYKDLQTLIPKTEYSNYL